MNRALDVTIAGAGLVVSSPFLVAAAVAVKLQDGGPVLYRQTRVGRSGADFELLKLRTMIVGAEKQGAGYAVDKGDARITRTGRLLRRLSLDELPQLWNVVRGDMSVIGPRPTLRYQVDQYDERQLHRLDVKPGITGWAQIHGRATPALGRPDRARPLVRSPSRLEDRFADSPAYAGCAIRRGLQGARRRVAPLDSSGARSSGLAWWDRLGASHHWGRVCSRRVGVALAPRARTPAFCCSGLDVSCGHAGGLAVSDLAVC